MKTKSLLFFYLWLGLLLTVTAQTPQLEKRQLLDGRVELLVPVSFTPMDKEMLSLKYNRNGNPPQYVLTDERGATNVAYSLKPFKATQENLSVVEKALYSSIKNPFPDAMIYGHGLKTIGGRQVGYLEMLVPGIDTEIYNMMFFTDLDGQLLIMTFNCVKKDVDIWKSSAHQIMQSLRIVKQ